MGFFKSLKTELGKKTGKAIGNKLFGAYADDKRVGINRGKQKEESDGLKFSGSYFDDAESRAEIRQMKTQAKVEKDLLMYETKRANNEAKVERDLLKYEIKRANNEARILREQMEYEFESKKEQAEYSKNQNLLDEVLKIEFNPNNKDEIVKSLMTLSSYIDLWTKNYNSAEHLEAASSKFDSGIAFLKSIDPGNSMILFFLQKRAERIYNKKKETKNTILIIIAILVFIGIMGALAILGFLD
jgi:hypothetical protein